MSDYLADLKTYPYFSEVKQSPSDKTKKDTADLLQDLKLSFEDTFKNYQTSRQRVVLKRYAIK